MKQLTNLLLILCLTACGGQPASNGAQSPMLSSMPSPTPISSPAPAAVQPLTGDFSVLSTTAMAFTGDLVITPGRFKFEYQDYTVGAPSQVDAKSDSPSGKSWSELLIVPEDATVLIWPITGATVAKDAPNGDLCRPDATRFLVTGMPGRFGDDGLHLAAFSSANPAASIAETEICGTFNYVATPAEADR